MLARCMSREQMVSLLILHGGEPVCVHGRYYINGPRPLSEVDLGDVPVMWAEVPITDLEIYIARLRW